LNCLYDWLSASAQAGYRRVRESTGRAIISGRPTRLRMRRIALISVAEKAQMIKICFVEKLTLNAQHFEYDGFSLISGRKYDLGCDARCLH